MFIIKHRNIFIGTSILLGAVSLGMIFSWGLRFGIDFTGGSLMEVEYAPAPALTETSRPDISEMKEIIARAAGEGVSEGAIVQPTGERGYIIRTETLSSDHHERILSALGEEGKWTVSEKRFDSVGPAIGEELRRKAWVAILAVMLAIIAFVAFVFRKVSEPVPSWQYGVITLVTLFHDVLIPTGAMALLGKIIGAQIDILFITALLTVLGFSVHDTIVVFDRVRENLKLKRFGSFAETVGRSLEQTFMRSINTSLTVILVLLALLFFGPPSIFIFSLVLLIGMIAGTYSSVFLASPLLLVAEKMKEKRQEKEKK